MINHGGGPITLKLCFCHVSFCLAAHLVGFCSCDVIVLEYAALDVFFFRRSHHWNLVYGLLMDNLLRSGHSDLVFLLVPFFGGQPLHHAMPFQGSSRLIRLSSLIIFNDDTELDGLIRPHPQFRRWWWLWNMSHINASCRLGSCVFRWYASTWHD